MGFISWVVDLINGLPDIFTFIVPGYLFLAIYRYILYKDEHTSSHLTLIIFNSIVISCILRVAFDGVIWCFPSVAKLISSEHKALILLVLACGLGYGAAKVLPSNAGVFVRRVLGINRTLNGNIWDDIMIPGIWIRVWLKDSNKSYLGQIKLVENYSREPIIVLEYYQFLDDAGNPVIDYSEDCHKTVMLNLSGFERVELIEN